MLNVAYPFAPVGPDVVGGAEQVLTQIDAALARAGHELLVMACEGSVTQGRLIAMPRAAGRLDDATRRNILRHYCSGLEELLGRERVDVLHFHGVDFCDYLPRLGVAALATLHLPPHWYPTQVFQLERPLTFLHCVSAAQRRACPPSPLLWPEIENGILPELFATRHGKRAFALALGLICPEKGFHLALEAAKRAQVPLLLAGQVFPYDAHEQYFEREIAPRLDASRRFIGPIGLKRKRRLLSAARCLLAPSLVPETSSLVVMEALACGTPVIAFRSGALAELVEPGKTGFLVKDHQEMAEAIRAVDLLERDACRQAAAERFSLQRMLEHLRPTKSWLNSPARRKMCPKQRASPLPWRPASAQRGLYRTGFLEHSRIMKTVAISAPPTTGANTATRPCGPFCSRVTRFIPSIRKSARWRA